MIIGIGHDQTEILRVQDAVARHGQRFLDRVFSATEQAYAAQKSTPEGRAATLAKRFAAKEACAKALGTGFGASAHWAEIEVQNDAKGKPSLVLSGQAAATLHALVPENHCAQLHLSLSDEGPLASAFVIIDAVPVSVPAP